MLCRGDCAKRVVSSFPYQIQTEYYGENLSVSIEGIVLESFSALPQTVIKESTKSCLCHAVFHSFLLDDIKQDAATTTAHSKRFIEMLKQRKIIDVKIKYNMVEY